MNTPERKEWRCENEGKESGIGDGENRRRVKGPVKSNCMLGSVDLHLCI